MTADTLGWLSEIAIGFRDSGPESRDPHFGATILSHPQVDREVIGCLAASSELARPILDHPFRGAGIVHTVFEVSIEQFHERAQLTFLRSDFADAYYAARLMSENSEAAAKGGGARDSVSVAEADRRPRSRRLVARRAC